jgi:HSP20 family protein
MRRDIFDEIRRMMEEMMKDLETMGFSYSFRAYPRDKFFTTDGMEFNFDVPKYEIQDDGDELVIIVEMPGVTKEDIDLNVTENYVDIKAEVNKENFQKRYQVRISLPCEVNPDKAKATYNNGILEITVPKLKPQKTKKVKVE